MEEMLPPESQNISGLSVVGCRPQSHGDAGVRGGGGGARMPASRGPSDKEAVTGGCAEAQRESLWGRAAAHVFVGQL